MTTNKTAVKQVKLTLMKSLNRRTERAAACVRGLGLRHRHHSVVVACTPENNGMINSIGYLLKIEDVA